MSISRRLKAFFCATIFLSQLVFGAIYPCPKNPISLPAPRGIPFLDDGLDDVGIYVEMINHWRENGHMNDEAKTILNQKLLNAIELFRPQIEHQPNFLACKEYWHQLNKEVSKLIENKAVDIPMMHIVGLKLVILKDISHLSSKENSDYFLGKLAKDVRNSDVILNVTDTLIRSIIKYSSSTIAHLLENSLKETRKLIKEHMFETMPLFNNSGVFGLNAFFYAFFNNIAIHTYPAAADSIVHAERYNTYQAYFEQLHYLKDSRLKLDMSETFFSSILFASHDRGHTQRYRLTFNTSDQCRLLRIYLSMDQNLLSSETLAKLIVLFYACHELEHTSTDDGIINRATYTFIDQHQYAGCCKTESERLLNAHYHKQRALEKTDDFASLLYRAGCDIAYNRDDPWNNGREVIRIFTEALGRFDYSGLPSGANS